MKTSTAQSNGFICPHCRDRLSQDHQGKGYVRHLSNPKCDGFVRGERDPVVQIVCTETPSGLAHNIGAQL